MNIQVSKLSIYREDDIKYKTPKMIIFSVFFFIIKHLFLCVKQTSLRDVSLTHQTHVLLTVIKKFIYRPISYSSVLEFISNKRVIQKIKFRIFKVLLYIVIYKLMTNLLRNH